VTGKWGDGETKWAEIIEAKVENPENLKALFSLVLLFIVAAWEYFLDVNPNDLLESGSPIIGRGMIFSVVGLIFFRIL